MADTEEWFLICRVATRLLALPLRHVVEVLRPPALERHDAGRNRTPASPTAAVPGLLGLALLRGELSPVLDLAQYLGWASDGSTSPLSARRLVSASLPTATEDGDSASRPAALLRARLLRPAGLLVDEVVGVQTVDPDTLSTIDLPGGAERRMGRFDAGLAECLSLAGILPTDLTAQEIVP